MALYKNDKHFNIGGDKTVEVTIVMDISDKADDTLILRNAEYYIKYFLNSDQNDEEGFVHPTWARSIEVRTKKRGTI